MGACEGWRPAMIAIVLCVLALLGTQAAQGQEMKLRLKSYEAAKSLLIKSGFKPVPLKHNKDTDFFCEEGFCQKYPEAINCSGTGLSPCRFVFFSKEKNAYFIVDTRGETRLAVTGTHWAHGYELADIREHQKN